MQKILIVDDSNTARMFVRRSLEIVGCTNTEIVEAENGKEALAILKRDDFTFIIADLNMPLMDGESFLRWMRHNTGLKEVPFIFITSANNKAKADQLIALGAHAVLSKPFTPIELSQTLQRLKLL